MYFATEKGGNCDNYAVVAIFSGSAGPVSEQLLCSPGCQYQVPRATRIAVLTEINSLPGAQCKLSFPDRDDHRAAEQSGFEVRGHIVGAFVIVLIVGVILRYRLVEIHFKINSDGWIGIFVDRQRSGSMLDKNLAHTCIDLPDFRKSMKDFVCNEVKPSPFFTQPDLGLKYLHAFLKVGFAQSYM